MDDIEWSNPSNSVFSWLYFINLDHIAFNMLDLIKCAPYDQSIYERHTISHIWPISLHYDIRHRVTNQGR